MARAQASAEEELERLNQGAFDASGVDLTQKEKAGRDQDMAVLPLLRATLARKRAASSD